MTKMNPEIKQQWVQALRSGEYEQGKGYLSRGGKFCCLGVLTDLAVKAGVAEWRLGGPGGGGGGVEAWSGVGDHEARHLVKLNDGEELTFPEIADYIEENL